MDTTITTTNLVISFSGTLNRLTRGTVTPADLDGAVFYFSCTRKHVFDHHGGEDYSVQTEVWTPSAAMSVEDAYQALTEAVLDAEAAGRVAWRELEERNSIVALNALLARNGLPEIDGSRHPFYHDSTLCLDESYTLPGIVDAVSVQNLPYKVLGYR